MLPKFANLCYILLGTFCASESFSIFRPLLYGLPKNLLQRLQYVLNAAARHHHVKKIRLLYAGPLLFQLLVHWLPVEWRIEF